MRERLVLTIIIACLWVFLFIFQNYMDTFWAIITLMLFMISYTIYMQAAFKHQVRKKRKNPPVINENYRPFVSIMVPAHNESNVIHKTIENILTLDYEDYELIVIDDRSDDNTAEIIQELSNKYDRVEALVRPQNAYPGKSAVLNDALQIAKGEIILVFDADARINPDFLKRIVPAIEPEDVGAVQARKVIINREENFLTRCQDNEMAVDTHFQVGRDAVKGAVELRGNGELLKRTAINDIGGWNNDTLTDDLDMSTRMHIKGWDVRFCPEVCVYEEGVLAYIPLVKQRRRWIEGSIRRYLEHFMDVITSKDVSKRVSLDMTAYISQFLLPFWLMSEMTFQAFRYIKGYEHDILSSLALAGIMCVFFISAFMYSLYKYLNFKPKEYFKQSIETCAYIVVLWFPIVVYIIFKIIFGKKAMDWGKTQHGITKQQDIKFIEPDIKEKIVEPIK